MKRAVIVTERIWATVAKPWRADVTRMSAQRKVFVISGDEVLHLEGRAGSDAGKQRRPAIAVPCGVFHDRADRGQDRKSTRLNSSHMSTSYAVFCLKKKN